MFGLTCFNRKFIDTGSIDDCIEVLMKQKTPDISMLLAYDEEWVTVAQQKKIDYILGQIAKIRER